MIKYKLNPDAEKVKEVTEAIKANEGYCPCSLEKTESTKCVCETTRETGECECGLFVPKTTQDFSNKATEDLIKDLKAENYDLMTDIGRARKMIDQIQQEIQNTNEKISNNATRIDQLQQQLNNNK